MTPQQIFRTSLFYLVPFGVAGVALYYASMTGGASIEGGERVEAGPGAEHGSRMEIGEEGRAGVRDGVPGGRADYEHFIKQQTPDQYIRGIETFLQMPSEPAASPSAVNSWTYKGPVSASYRGTKTEYCGRVRDLEVENVPSMRVASGTGGLFKTVLLFPVPMSDSVDTRNTGAFASSPRNPAIVLLGTGEPPNYSGTGLWRTTDEGETWKNVMPYGSIFYKIMFQPGSDSIAYAASNLGLFRSKNAGATWTSTVTGQVTGFDIVPTAPNIVYAAVRKGGIYKSIDFGVSFRMLASFPLTDTLLTTASIAIAKSNIKIVYVNVANHKGSTSGLYRTSDGGDTWQDRSWLDTTGATADIHWGQGGRNNCVGVSPTDPNLVIVGGGGLVRTTDGGITWTVPPAPHTDHCVIKWKSDGSTVYSGNDGGISVSTDAGVTWTTTGSVFPIMEFWSIDAASSPSGMVFVGGTQDNAVVNTSNNGARWYYNRGGDGGGATIDKHAPGTQLVMVHSGSGVPHDIYRTTDYGMTWALTGVNRDRPGGRLANDNAAPTQFFLSNANAVYRSIDAGVSWNRLGDSLPTTRIGSISVGRRTGGIAPVYAVLPDTANKIMYYGGSSWVPRNSGLPSVYINSISQHPTDNNYAYAWSFYNSNPEDKIFRTTNRGVLWTNITGDFPGFTVTGIVAHPTNHRILFASTTWYGMFKTTNGGENWFRWMNGMPKTLWVESLAYIDSSAINGKFYVVAGSHGRGVWVREAGGDETATHAGSGEQPLRYALEQNYPNPFNPSTLITFELAAKDQVTLEVFDINGKVVRQVIRSQEYAAGKHDVRFDARGLASGTYFYRLTSPRFSSVKKMMLLK